MNPGDQIKASVIPAISGVTVPMSVVHVVVVPLVFTDGTRGVALTEVEHVDDPALMFTAEAARTLLSELLRHVEHEVTS